MVTITVSNKKIHEQPAECIGVMLEQDTPFTPQLKALADTYYPGLEAVIKKREFTAALNTSLLIPATKGDKVVHLALIGVGKKNKKGILDIEQCRRALARVLRLAETHKCASVAISLPQASLFGVNEFELAKQTAIALNLAAYYFDEYITEKERKVRHLKEAFLVVEKGRDEDAGLKEGALIADAVNTARHWIDSPPTALAPIHLASKARDIANEYGLKVTIFNEHEITQMGMGGLAGVSKGSDQDAQLVIMEYKTKKKDAQTICLVGKGITFDSGGLSLKPPANMETMKDDMSGAAAVISTMKALAQLKPDVNVIAITPLSENLPSGKATKPGDILTFYNGKTAEVLNTDAEGRLILADALAYAVKTYKLDAIIDIATLTGACSHALGPFFTGLMSQHEDLSKRIQDAADRTGDRVWPLPLDDDFKPAIKSPVADISNIGSQKYRAGAITAAFFLQHFVNDVPWAHLDIAGSSFEVPDIPYFRPEGATGAGVRLMIDLAMNWK